MGEGRRHTDGMPFDFDDLLVKETDDRHRLFMVTFKSINENIGAQTSMIMSLTASFQQHLENYERHLAEYEREKRTREALANRAKGWRDVLSRLAPLLTCALTILQLGTIGIGTMVWREYQSFKTAIEEVKHEHIEQTRHIKEIEAGNRHE